MRQKFSLFNTPIDLAHFFWQKLLLQHPLENACVVDATCGNGKDSLFLSTLLTQPGSTLFCLDIQQTALDTTKALLKEKKSPCFVHFILGSHSTLPVKSEQAVLIVYNLGYLPKGDKSLTTTVSSTLSSVKNALDCVSEKGLISIICYPGHPEGKKEEDALFFFLSSLDPKLFCFTPIFFPNRELSPSLFLVQRS